MRIDTRTAERDEIADQVEAMVGSFDLPNRKIKTASVYYAAAAMNVLGSHGIKAMLQAGTALWPRIRRDQDDGVQTTHWGYVYDPLSQEAEDQYRAGQLPDLHAWVAIVGKQEVVDFTVGQQPLKCQMELGLSCIEYPRYFWGRSEQAVEGWIRYIANQSAMRACYEALHAEGFVGVTVL